MKDIKAVQTRIIIAAFDLISTLFFLPCFPWLLVTSGVASVASLLTSGAGVPWREACSIVPCSQLAIVLTVTVFLLSVYSYLKKFPVIAYWTPLFYKNYCGKTIEKPYNMYQKTPNHYPTAWVAHSRGRIIGVCGHKKWANYTVLLEHFVGEKLLWMKEPKLIIRNVDPLRDGGALSTLGYPYKQWNDILDLHSGGWPQSFWVTVYTLGLAVL